MPLNISLPKGFLYPYFGAYRGGGNPPLNRCNYGKSSSFGTLLYQWSSCWNKNNKRGWRRINFLCNRCSNICCRWAIIYHRRWHSGC